MLQLRLTLNNTHDAEQNILNDLLSRPSSDEIARLLCHCCKVLSSLSRDEIALLYERARTSTDCLVDFDIKECCQVKSPATGTSTFGSVAHARSLEPVCIDPSLLTTNMDVRDRKMAPCVSTPVPSRFPTLALSNAGVMLSQPASPPRETVPNLHANPSPVIPHDGCPSNEFDWVLRECDNLNAPDSSLNFVPGPCDPTKESDSSILHLTGGSEGQCPPGIALDEDGPMASIPTSQSPVCGRPVGIGERSPETPPHHASAGIMEEGGLNEMEVSDAEEEAQQDVTGKNPIENRPAVGSSSPSLYPVAGISYPTPNSNSPDTPVTTRRVERSAEVTTSDVDSEDRTVDKRQSARTFSKLQPTVEDAPDDAELDNPETSSINDEDLSMDEDFGDSDIESALEDTVRFLQDTSCNSETPSTDANTSVNTESNPKSLTPVSISPAFNESDQHKFPNGEQQTNSSQETLEYENRQILQQKRKLPAGLEPHSTLYTRNLRPRLDKGKGGNQAPHDDEIAEDVGKNSSSEGVLADSVAKSRADSSIVAHLKTSVPSNSDKDKWSGPLLCHSLLSTLSSEKKAEIERKCSRISRPDLPEFMEKHTKLWKATGFWDSPRLDVENHSLVSSNAEGFAIWRYVDAIQTGEETHYLKSRLADIMLYLAYIKELRRQKDAGHPPQTAKVKATDIICGTASLSKAIGERTRKSFHEHKLVGERWWWSGCHLGRGFFLLCSQETGKKIQSKTFSLDAFILYVLWNCQHIIACCDKFEQLVDGLLTGGEFTEQLTKKEVQLWIREAKAVSWKDTYIDCWKPWSTNAVASKASEFLTARSSDPEHPR